jgi:hypothetical protein
VAFISNPGSSGGGLTKEGCSVILTAKKEVTNSASYLIPWDEVASAAKLGYNTGVWSTTSEETRKRFTATSTGLWLPAATIWYDAENSTGERALHCVLEGNNKKKVGGDNKALNATNGRVLHCIAPVWLTSGQWVAFECFQDSGGTRKLEKDGWESEFPMGRATFHRIQ